MLTGDRTETLAERVARRTRHTLLVLDDTAGGEPITPEPPAEVIAAHGPHLVACLRLVIEAWAGCGAVPQPLSVEIMRAKSALEAAVAEGGGDA